jgi:RimJ/RimL family protein N-acetyltransferase
MDASLDLLLIDVPERIVTERLILRCPQPGDGAALNAAVAESLESLRPWMPWAQGLPGERESEATCRRMNGRFRLRQDLAMFLFERREGDAEGDFVGGTGLHRIDWALRSFEVGYWCRRSHAGLGFTGEAVRALTAMAFHALGARRLQIRTDAANGASRRVAERCGFVLEGVLRSDALTPQGEPRDTCVFARVAGVQPGSDPGYAGEN